MWSLTQVIYSEKGRTISSAISCMIALLSWVLFPVHSMLLRLCLILLVMLCDGQVKVKKVLLHSHEVWVTFPALV